MKANRYKIELTGETPLLLHHDNIAWADVLAKWGKDPANKKNSVAGDDRSPAFRWIGNLYVDGGLVVVPSDNLMTMLREGGAKCPTGKKGATFKRQTQSGIVVDQAAWPITIGGKTLAYDRIKPLMEEEDFSKHSEAVAAMGFDIFVKRAKVAMAKHIRVRPRFDKWSVEGTVTVLDDTITKDVLENIVVFAGMYSGLGDWRPSSPKSPGSFGKFTAKVRAV
jgi:hypothetical protein